MEIFTTWLIILLIASIVYIVIYNIIIMHKQKVSEAWSDVDVQLKRRHDLIPNLVNTVKGYAQHEKDLLEKVTKERTKAMEIDQNDLQKLGSIEGELGEDINSVLMVAEGYPDLKANQNFLKLQEELTETEDQIASSRRIYNANVTAYNFLVKIFPLNIVSYLASFKEIAFLEFKSARKTPSVN